MTGSEIVSGTGKGTGTERTSTARVGSLLGCHDDTESVLQVGSETERGCENGTGTGTTERDTANS